MARWIAVRSPFNYHWPDRSAVTSFSEPGDFFVKDEVADFAVQKGYASEGKVDASARSTKGAPKRARARRRKEPTAASPPNDRPDDAVAEPDLAVHDRPADRDDVDQDAG